jgi:hypothetical protein
MQESLPFNGITSPFNGTTSSVPHSSVSQNLNSDFDSDQLSSPITHTLPSTEITPPDPQTMPKQVNPTIPTNPVNPANPINPTNSVNPTNSIPTVSPLPTPEPANSVPIINDPFQYRLPDGRELIPRNISSLPPGIQVIGILIFQNQKSIAAIRLPRTGNQRASEIYYVREGDLIEVPSNLLPNRRTAAQRGIDDTEILFLRVEKITPQHVEVTSGSNVDDRHILR